MNRIDLLALTLVGPTGTSPVLDPLAVLRLNNKRYLLKQNILEFCASNEVTPSAGINIMLAKNTSVMMAIYGGFFSPYSRYGHNQTQFQSY